jgi:hypothetical protein
MARESWPVSLIERAVGAPYTVLGEEQFNIITRLCVIKMPSEIIRYSPLRHWLGLNPWIKTMFGRDAVRTLQSIKSKAQVPSLEVEVDPRNPRNLILYIKESLYKEGDGAKNTQLPTCVDTALKAVDHRRKMPYLVNLPV